MWHSLSDKNWLLPCDIEVKAKTDLKKLANQVKRVKSSCDDPGIPKLKVFFAQGHVFGSALKSSDTKCGVLSKVIQEYLLVEDRRVYYVSPENTSSDIEYACFLNVDAMQKLYLIDQQVAGMDHQSFALGSALGCLLDQSPTFMKGTDVQLEFDVVKWASAEPSQFRTPSQILDSISKEQLVAGLYQGALSNRIRPQLASKDKLHVYVPFETDEVEKGAAISTGLISARSLVNLPPNHLTPDIYEDIVKELCNSLHDICHHDGDINLEVVDYETLKKDKAGLIVAVGKGSKSKPRILKLSWNPKQSSKKSLAFVGKGITFDSGGLNLKSGSGMRIMKKDMGGSACVLGAFITCAISGCKTPITTYLAIAENMVSGECFRPGDVHTSLSGKKVEIDNTDAEGRLVLADALTYAVKDKHDLIIDVATLTGAARVALGPQIDPYFANHNPYAQKMEKTAQRIGDFIWRLPLVEFYQSYLESGVGDKQNSSSSGFGGAVTAALFLQDFVEDTPWIHIDCYMWTDKPNHYVREAGACPRAVRLLSEFANEFGV